MQAEFVGRGLPREADLERLGRCPEEVDREPREALPRMSKLEADIDDTKSRVREYFQEYFVKLLEDQELVKAPVSDFKPTIRIRTHATEEHEISQPSCAQLIALVSPTGWP